MPSAKIATKPSTITSFPRWKLTVLCKGNRCDVYTSNRLFGDSQKASCYGNHMRPNAQAKESGDQCVQFGWSRRASGWCCLLCQQSWCIRHDYALYSGIRVAWNHQSILLHSVHVTSNESIFSKNGTDLGRRGSVLRLIMTNSKSGLKSDGELKMEHPLVQERSNAVKMRTG